MDGCETLQQESQAIKKKRLRLDLSTCLAAEPPEPMTDQHTRTSDNAAEPDGRAVAAAASYLAAIVDSAEDAILSKSLDGIIQSCNVAAEHLFGYSSEELIGHPVRMLIPQERQSEEDEILARLRRGERIEHFETVRVAKDGRRIDIALDGFAGARCVGDDYRCLEDRSRYHGAQAGGG